MEGMNTILYFWWIEESRDFDVFLFSVFVFCFLFFFVFFGCVWKKGEQLRNRLGREQAPGSLLFFCFFFFWSRRCLGPFIAPARFTRWWPFIGRPFKSSWIGLILTPLERSWLPVFEKLWNLKIQRSDQKLRHSEINGASIDALPQFS